tara:strand:- start:6438 stop:6797 length:360 start_codon:yes stop_codon:yes gene_type:complete
MASFASSKQTGFGVILNKTDLEDGTEEDTYEFIDSRSAQKTQFQILCSVNGSFHVYSKMRGSGTFAQITSTPVTHTGHATEPTVYLVDFPLGVSKITFTPSATDAAGTLEVQARSIPRR